MLTVVSRGVGFMVVGTCAAIGAVSVVARVVKWKIGYDQYKKSATPAGVVRPA